MKKLNFVLSLLLCMFSFSCQFQKQQKETVSFDNKTFLQKLESWNAAGIKNYSFSYSFRTVVPEEVIGNVTVKDGKGSVSFSYPTEGEFLVPKEGDLYYITCIEDIFKNIEAEKQLSIKELEENKIDYSHWKIEYDECYFFPKYTYESRGTYNNKSDELTAGTLSDGFLIYILDKSFLSF